MADTGIADPAADVPPAGTGFVWWPDAQRVADANLTAFLRAVGVADHDALLARADADPEWFWDALIRFLDVRFTRPWDRLLDMSGGIEFPRWCTGATTNFVLNALDRHAGRLDDRPALIGVSEMGEDRTWTYRDLSWETARLAAGLASLGIGRGDVVGMLMPTIPEAAAALLAIAKLGAIALPIFSGFGPDAVASRLDEGGAVAVLCADGTLRRGRRVAMKATLDAALGGVPSVRHVVVLRRLDPAGPLVPGRDVDWADLVAGRPDAWPTAEVEAEHPLMIVFTSGSSGRPKGVVHTHVGFTVKAAQDSQLYLDLKAGDRMLRMADLGFLGGPLAIGTCCLAGAAFVMFDGAPDHPGPDRLWRTAERHGATVLGIVPTLARSLRRQGGGGVEAMALPALRTIISAGEPWDEESWTWVFEAVGKHRLPILNYSGGTEIGTILSGHVLAPQKPGSFSGPVAGTGAAIVDADGRPVPVGERGELVMAAPCIGRTTMLWRDRERYLDSYWRQMPGMWVQGDWASRDTDGCWFLHGRSDDSIKVAARRVGPAEVEAVLLATGLVADAAAVGVPDPVRGSAVACVVVPLAADPAADLHGPIAEALVSRLGPSFRPALVLPVADLPRTRNGKVVRRAVRAALLGEAIVDRAGLLDEAPLAAIEAAAGRLGRKA